MDGCATGVAASAMGRMDGLELNLTRPSTLAKELALTLELIAEGGGRPRRGELERFRAEVTGIEPTPNALAR